MLKWVLIVVGVLAVLGIGIYAVSMQQGAPAVANVVVSPTSAPEATVPAQPTDVPTPSPVPPTPTPTIWTFAAGSEILGEDVGGLTEDVATTRVAAALDQYKRTLTLETQGYSTTLDTADVLTLPDAEKLVGSGRDLAQADKPVDLPLEDGINNTALTSFLDGIAPKITHAMATTVISDAKAITETYTFTAQPARKLEVQASAEKIAQAILAPHSADQVDLVTEETVAQRPPFSELDRVLQDHAAYWKGVAGFYVHDLQTGETLTYNGDTVFSGASVMKVPIMIFAYSRLGKLNDTQHEWMRKMIIDSENLEANSLLAAAVNSEGTEAALEGVNEMSKMLKDLGLEHSYQLIPYESGEWLIQQSLLPSGGPKHEGAAPYMAPDPYIRTTPKEMGELFVMLDQCAQDGTGPLIEKVGDKLNQDLCKEMVDWLQQPHDQDRMVAGLPPGTVVAHKGGWIDDMQSDVGIVDSAGGRYVAAIYIWRDGYVTDVYAHPSPYLGDFSHTIYTFFNPQPYQEPEQAGQ